MSKTRTRCKRDHNRGRHTAKKYRQRGGFKVGQVVGLKRDNGKLFPKIVRKLYENGTVKLVDVGPRDRKSGSMIVSQKEIVEVANNFVFPPYYSPHHPFREIHELLSIAENVGSIPAPGAGDINLLTLDEFRHGEDVIILVEKDASGVEHKFMFKKEPLIDWFNGLIRDNRPLANPLTRTPIIQPGKQLYTRNPAVQIKIGKIEGPVKLEIPVEHRKSFKFRLKKASIPETSAEPVEVPAEPVEVPAEVPAEKPAKKPFKLKITNWRNIK
jgi:hypothetical protein